MWIGRGTISAEGENKMKGSFNHSINLAKALLLSRHCEILYVIAKTARGIGVSFLKQSPQTNCSVNSRGFFVAPRKYQRVTPRNDGIRSRPPMTIKNFLPK
jgi:hypothetical protein